MVSSNSIKKLCKFEGKISWKGGGGLLNPESGISILLGTGGMDIPLGYRPWHGITYNLFHRWNDHTKQNVLVSLKNYALYFLFCVSSSHSCISSYQLSIKATTQNQLWKISIISTIFIRFCQLFFSFAKRDPCLFVENAHLTGPPQNKFGSKIHNLRIFVQNPSGPQNYPQSKGKMRWAQSWSEIRARMFM